MSGPSRTVPSVPVGRLLAPRTGAGPLGALLRRSVPPANQRAYRGALARLNQWLGLRPLTEDALAQYVAACHLAGRAPATI